MAAYFQPAPAPYLNYYDPSPHLSTATSPSYLEHNPHHHRLNDPINQISQPSNAYMNPILPQPPSQFSFQPPPYHGIKRSASEDDELEQSSHISNQFKKLRLNNQRQQHSHPPVHQELGQHHGQPTPAAQHDIEIPREEPDIYSSPAHPPTLPSSDFMTVDETPDKIYISDLDSEIASIEAAEQSASQLFLPDFEKRIGAIPDHILRSNRAVHPSEVGESSNTNAQALVLYKEPTSISVPEEEDAVRKAVLESRRGIREKMRREQQRERETAHIHFADIGKKSDALGLYNAHSPRSSLKQGDRYDMNSGMQDEDAMDIE